MEEIDLNQFRKDYEKLPVKELMKKYNLTPSRYYYLTGMLKLPFRPRGRKKDKRPRLLVSVQLLKPKSNGYGYKASTRRTIIVHTDNVEKVFNDILEVLLDKGWISKFRYLSKKVKKKLKEVS